MRAPVLAAGDGALGFWGALREVFPETREQRCWFHKNGECAGRAAEVRAPGGEESPGRDLGRGGQAARPRRGQGLQRRPRREVPHGRREDHRRRGRAAGVLRLPLRALGAPAHDQPESTFATVRHRTKITRGPGSRAAGAGDGVQAHRSRARPLARRQRTHLVALVRAGATFINGRLVERPGENTEPEAA